MGIFKKPISEVNESDLQTLIDNGVRESKEIEYKSILEITTEKQKAELCKDVSAFSNTNGGCLIYGISEDSAQDSGVPKDLCGMKEQNKGDTVNQIHNILDSGLDPKIRFTNIEVIDIPSSNGKVCILMDIPKSFSGPHMVKSTGRFHYRNSCGVSACDTAELRLLFDREGAKSDLARKFRSDRISRIKNSHELPASLDPDCPKLVVHIFSLDSFSAPSPLLDVEMFKDYRKWELLVPMIAWDHYSGMNVSFNFDGPARVVQLPQVQGRHFPLPCNYVQLFRNGVIELVDASILTNYGLNDDFFRIDVLEVRILQAVKNHLKIIGEVGLSAPIFVAASFLNVKGLKTERGSKTIDREDLIIPEVSVESLEFDHVAIERNMKPVFDSLWNAVDRYSSSCYNEDGTYGYVWYSY